MLEAFSPGGRRGILVIKGAIGGQMAAGTEVQWKVSGQDQQFRRRTSRRVSRVDELNSGSQPSSLWDDALLISSVLVALMLLGLGLWQWSTAVLAYSLSLGLLAALRASVIRSKRRATSSEGHRFRRRTLRRGYKVDEVDAFLDHVEATIAGDLVGHPATPQEVHDVVFRERFGGYDEFQVDAHLDLVEQQLTRNDARTRTSELRTTAPPPPSIQDWRALDRQLPENLARTYSPFLGRQWYDALILAATIISAVAGALQLLR